MRLTFSYFRMQWSWRGEALPRERAEIHQAGLADRVGLAPGAAVAGRASKADWEAPGRALSRVGGGEPSGHTAQMFAAMIEDVAERGQALPEAGVWVGGVWLLGAGLR